MARLSHAVSESNFSMTRPGVVCECTPTPGTRQGAIALVVDVRWPPRAVTMRVLDVDGREVHIEVKGESKG